MNNHVNSCINSMLSWDPCAILPFIHAVITRLLEWSRFTLIYSHIVSVRFGLHGLDHTLINPSYGLFCLSFLHGGRNGARNHCHGRNQLGLSRQLALCRDRGIPTNWRVYVHVSTDLFEGEKRLSVVHFLAII